MVVFLVSKIGKKLLFSMTTSIIILIQKILQLQFFSLLKQLKIIPFCKVYFSENVDLLIFYFHDF